MDESELESVGRAACDLPCWSFSIEEDEGDFRMISVSEQGGQVLSVTGSRRVSAKQLSAEEAQAAAEEFLEQAGMDVTELVSSSEDGGLAAFTFAGSENGVMYPADAVSISIALDDGSVCSYDATEYILNHTERDLGEPAVTAEQAAAIGPVDAVLVPVGGVYTVDAAGAKAVCDALHPRCVVPMHYHHAPYGLTEVDSVEPFLELWPAEAVHHLQGAAFELTEQTAGVMVPSF